MEGHDQRPADDGADADGEDPVRVRCTTDPVAHDLDVDWTKGAVFEFASRAAAERWLAAESRSVPGTFYLADAPSDAALSVAYHVRYTGGEG